MMVRPPRIIDINTLACWSWPRGTSWGSIAARAGMLSAEAVPISPARHAICQICACPLTTRAAIESWLTPATRLLAWITSVRPNRSATTPPTSRKTTRGMLLAASTVPRALGESLTSSTAKARATLAMVPPTRLTKREAAYQRKLGSPSGARAAVRVTASSGTRQR